MASPRSRAQRRARTAFGVVAVAAAAAAAAAAQPPDAVPSPLLKGPLDGPGREPAAHVRVRGRWLRGQDVCAGEAQEGERRTRRRRAHCHVPTAGVLAVMQTSAGSPEARMRATGIVAARIAQEMAPQQETREGVPAGLPGVPTETPVPETPFELVFGGAHPAFAEVPRCIRDNHQYTVAGAEGREWSAEIGLGPDTNEHIFDVFLLAELRAMQTRSRAEVERDARPNATAGAPSAPVRVIDAPFFGSWIAGTCANSTHAERMKALDAAIVADVDGGGPGARGAVVILGSYNPATYTPGPLLARLNGAISARVDTNFKNSPPFLRGEHVLVVPYLAHAFLVEAAAGELAPPALAARSVSVVFWGSGNRRGAGSLRCRISGVAEAWWPSASVKMDGVHSYKRKGSHISAQDWSMTHSEAYAAVMRSATLCLVPEGDTLTSRRLFDALAAGCVPVVVAPVCGMMMNLPFTSWIQWERAAVFINGMRCAVGQKDLVEPFGARLAVLAAAASPELAEAKTAAAANLTAREMQDLGESMRDMQAYGARVYRRWLAYGHNLPIVGGAAGSSELYSGPAKAMLADAAKHTGAKIDMERTFQRCDQVVRQLDVGNPPKY